MNFTFEHLAKVKLQNPVLIEGLPGIGNVGKIAIDFLAESVEAKKIVNIYSHYLPHSVFINEKNLIDVPVLTICYKRIKNRDYLFLVGDVQPIDEPSCYEFCEALMDYLQKIGCKEIVTLGGIGLQRIPKKPKVYITGTDKKLIKTFAADNKIYGVVGPIIGVTGVLLGIAQKKNVPSAALLVQTFAHPAYMGIKGAKQLLHVLNEKYSLNLNLRKLSEEIDEIEKEIATRTKSTEIAGEKPAEEPSYFG